MHLHGHLIECIKDFGPVYYFWCFAFERLNGILGSYHVNNQHISIQFTRRFLDSKAYAPSNWPNQYINEYLPLLNSFRYQQGGLQQKTIETEISLFNCDNIFSLPSIREYALDQHEKDSICSLLDKTMYVGTYHLLVLYTPMKALLVQKFVIGAEGSWHTKSSLDLAKNRVTNSITLAKITCTVGSGITSERSKIWMAAVEWYMDHPCKSVVWESNSSLVYSHLPWLFLYTCQ